jgi:hypothetical protein
MCTPRERASAIIAIVFAFLLALCIFVVAFLEHGGGGGSGLGGSGGLASSGIGSGDGSGIGPGRGTGAADEGAGPGAGDAGSGRGDRGPDEPMPPPGSDADVVAQAEVPPPAQPMPEIEPPEFGFTAPEAPKPAPQPVPPVVTTGTPTIRPTKGATGAGGGAGSEFMGIRSTGEHVVYVIDASLSMQQGGRFDHARLELKRSIERLPVTATFAIVFFFAKGEESSSYSTMPPGSLVRATKRSKEEALAWISSQVCSSELRGAEPTNAITAAFGMSPDVIFLLTDGEQQYITNEMGLPVSESWEWIERTISRIDQLAASHPVSVNTIGFHTKSSEPYLRRIASTHNGVYRFVGPAGVSP